MGYIGSFVVFKWFKEVPKVCSVRGSFIQIGGNRKETPA